MNEPGFMLSPVVLAMAGIVWWECDGAGISMPPLWAETGRTRTVKNDKLTRANTNSFLTNIPWHLWKPRASGFEPSLAG